MAKCLMFCGIREPRGSHDPIISGKSNDLCIALCSSGVGICTAGPRLPMTRCCCEAHYSGPEWHAACARLPILKFHLLIDTRDANDTCWAACSRRKHCKILRVALLRA